MTQRTERRLAAILALDVVGYSRLMNENETGTLAQLKAHRRELVDPKIGEYGGTIIKEIGDGLLVEFHSAVAGVECAIDIQRAMARRNAEVPESLRIQFRAGLNVGDVIVDEDDLFGDGVNIASRLEALAEPGGVCISSSVYEQIRNKLFLDFDDMGDREIKNIAEPVHVYQVSLTAPVRQPQELAAGKGNPRPDGRLSNPVMAIGSALVAVVMIALLVWRYLPGEPEQPQTAETPPAADLIAALSDPVDGKNPSIAVLPFNNMSGDEEQEYFSDGITEDIITDLSQISGLRVIARNSVFTYKGRAAKAEDIGRDLGVRYLLEGSVRRAGGQVRINAQLIDARDGSHLWAERFDRAGGDIFRLQDEVTQRIVTALAVKLTSSEQERMVQREKTIPEAYDTLLRGLQQLRRFTRETNKQARRYFQEAIELDPKYARAYANVAITYSVDVAFGWSADPKVDIDQALAFADQAFALDETVRQVPFARATVYMRQGRLDEALTEIQKAIVLDPNYADAYARLGETLVFAGRADEGLRAITKAMRLNPHHSFMYRWFLGKAYFALERYEEAAETLEYAIEQNPEFPGSHLMLAATYGQMGELEDAQWEASEVITLLPGFSLDKERSSATYENPEDIDRYIGGLSKAGLGG